MSDSITKKKEYDDLVESKNLLLPGYNKTTTRIWQSNSNDRHDPSDFILPVFIVKDENAKNEIKSLPHVYQFGINKLVEYLRPLVDLGLKTILVFPVTDEKGLNCFLTEKSNPAFSGIKVLKREFPDLIIAVDVCLCTFTEDGHCCVFNEEGQIDNKSTLEQLSNLAIAYANVGCDILAPSTKNDSYVSFIKKALIRHKKDHIPVMAYGAKFASCLYGPFRNAANSAPKFGNRKSYQFPIGSRGLSLRGVERDIEEGADYVMVKPGIFYLDIIREVANKHQHIPIAVYQVSGEYNMIWAGCNDGAFDLKTAVFESCTCFKRAGASIIISYFTPFILDWIRKKEFTFE